MQDDWLEDSATQRFGQNKCCNFSKNAVHLASETKLKGHSANALILLLAIS
jgi:hypothetical protein